MHTRVHLHLTERCIASQVYGVAFALWELLAVPVPMGALLAGVWSLTLLHWRGRHEEARGLEALFGFAAVLVLACAAGQLFLAVPSWSNPFFELVELAEGLLVRFPRPQKLVGSKETHVDAGPHREWRMGVGYAAQCGGWGTLLNVAAPRHSFCATAS